MEKQLNFEYEQSRKPRKDYQDFENEMNQFVPYTDEFYITKMPLPAFEYTSDEFSFEWNLYQNYLERP